MIERFIDRSKALNIGRESRGVNESLTSKLRFTKDTHRFDSLLVVLSRLYCVISGLPRFTYQLVRLEFDLREFLLDEIQRTVRVPIDSFEWETRLEEFESVEDRGGEGGDSVVERGSVGV